MPPRPTHLGLPAIPALRPDIDGRLCDWRDGTYYRIDGYDFLDPFLTTVVSDCDLWMYVASTGGLTAGRESAARALFPYETVDKLFRSHPHTGPRTVIRILEDEQTWVWQPFAPDGRLRYELNRVLYKHVMGCELWFEERNESLGLTFRYGWRPGRRLGWIRSAELINDRSTQRRVAILDGIQNLMPAGVDTGLQDTFSCLVDAYKTAEVTADGTLALFRLTARIIDRAEASESLRTTVAWRAGLPGAATLLDSSHWEPFMRGVMPSPEARLHGRPGSYLVCDECALKAGDSLAWHIVLDTPVDHAGVAALGRAIESDAAAQIDADVAGSRVRLRRFLSAADASQSTGDPVAVAHHASNVLFNIARGGVLPHGYVVERDDLARFIMNRNRRVAARHAAWLRGLPERISLLELHPLADATGDLHLARLCVEYLPIVFSRRHGDPSRPWNRFTIAVDNADGSLRHGYEGNWRDIFQNWEALCRSFPECIEPMIAKFLNASTIDGFNPYRITHDGIEWEVPDPAHPWSSIGYWGDHQLVYLLALLDMSVAHHPGRLAGMLERRAFTYADVPYDIRSYEEIVADPARTIVFNGERDRAARARVEETGTDGRLVQNDGEPLHVTMAEKLLVPALAKVSNLVPGGGVWMNTMRPEWNDANNALAGSGLSVVTTCHLYRYLGFCAELFKGSSADGFELSSHVARWLEDVASVIGHAGIPADDRARREFLDACGRAFSRYRNHVYAAGPGDPVTVPTRDIVAFLRGARTLAGRTIDANRRSDGLYHAYNLLHLGDATAGVSHLALMLEGQVAALQSERLSPPESVSVLEALRASALYIEDQQSYLLYPEKELPDFMAINRVPDAVLAHAPVTAARVAAGDHRVLERDAGGQLRFNADLHNAGVLQQRLDDAIPAMERRVLLDAYEAVFNHASFTGRSGTMYRYEGIGCIYWHMVAKLMLAVRDVCRRATESGADAAVVAALLRHGDDIRSGLGFMKTPAAFGAIPLDAYSHTPRFGGASQPGMTGQVKEELLARWLELGVHVRDGQLVLDPSQVLPRELSGTPGPLVWLDADGAEHSLPLRAGELGFTVCQVPVVYSRGPARAIGVRFTDGRTEEIAGTVLPPDLSAQVFSRAGSIDRLTVYEPHTT